MTSNTIPKNEKILVRMPNWIGDAVMATPLLEDIKTKYKPKELCVLCHHPIHDLLKNNPFIDRFIPFDRTPHKKKQEANRIIKDLREEHFPIGLLVTQSFSSAWWFFRAQVAQRIGYRAHFRSPLLNYPLRLPKKEEHLVTTYKRLLAPFGIELSDTKPKLFLREEERQKAKKALEQQGIQKEHKIVGINAAAAYGSAKCWLPDRFSALAKALLDNPNNILLFFGDKKAQPLVENICQELPQKHIINLAGKTSLRELLAYLELCDCFVTNDSGPMHIAAALNTPLIALFGSTNEVKTGPYLSKEVIHKHVACSPCYFRKCPIDFRCMKSITTKEVFEKVQQSLKSHD